MSNSAVYNAERDVRLLSEPSGGVPDLISTREGFDDFVERFASASGPLAADAERASGYRYSQQDWLVQFKRQGAGIALVDPVAVAEKGAQWEDFNQALGDTEWIIHDSLQDLPGYYALGMRPSRLFDTERAARLLGNAHFGLAAVTEKYLGLTLAKEHSAADWSYRPLNRDMRNYAALDVEVLIELRNTLSAELRRSGKEEWAQEDFAFLLKKGSRPRPERIEPWRHISRINSLDRDLRGLAVARQLWTVRDYYAKQYDIAPNLLLQDSAIIEAAQRKPHNSREFASIRSLNQRVRMRKGDERDKMFERYAPIQRRVKPAVWKQAIRQALDLPDDQLPSRKNVRPDESGTNAPKSMKLWKSHHPDRYACLEAAKRRINQISQDTQTPADILLKPQILRNLCWHAKDLPLRSREREGSDSVHTFLMDQGARRWQADLLSESLTSVII